MQRVEDKRQWSGRSKRKKRSRKSKESHMWLLQSNGGNNHLLFGINRAINREMVSILEKYDLIRQCL